MRRLQQAPPEWAWFTLDPELEIRVFRGAHSPPKPTPVGLFAADAFLLEGPKNGSFSEVKNGVVEDKDDDPFGWLVMGSHFNAAANYRPDPGRSFFLPSGRTKTQMILDEDLDVGTIQTDAERLAAARLLRAWNDLEF